MIPALFQVAFALVIVGAVALAVDRPWTLHVERQALFAVLWLGFLGSGLAYLIFFRLLARRRADFALRFVDSLALSGGDGRSTPALRAFDSPIAIACFVERAPCLPSRTW